MAVNYAEVHRNLIKNYGGMKKGSSKSEWEWLRFKNKEELGGKPFTYQLRLAPIIPKKYPDGMFFRITHSEVGLVSKEYGKIKQFGCPHNLSLPCPICDWLDSFTAEERESWDKSTKESFGRFCPYDELVILVLDRKEPSIRFKVFVPRHVTFLSLFKSYFKAATGKIAEIDAAESAWVNIPEVRELYRDLSDVTNGKDLIIEQGSDGKIIALNFCSVASPLTKTSEEVESLCNNTPDVASVYHAPITTEQARKNFKEVLVSEEEPTVNLNSPQAEQLFKEITGV